MVKFLQLCLLTVLSCNNSVNSGIRNEKSEQATQNSIQKNSEKYQVETSYQNQIEFEDIVHYGYSVTDKDFWLINSQAEMDQLFFVVHQKIEGNRLPPIPTVMENESYLVVKPPLKKANDVKIKSIGIQKSTLIIVYEDYNDVQINEKSRNQPNVFLKLNQKLVVNKIIYQYN